MVPLLATPVDPFSSSMGMNAIMSQKLQHSFNKRSCDNPLAISPLLRPVITNGPFPIEAYKNQPFTSLNSHRVEGQGITKTSNSRGLGNVIPYQGKNPDNTTCQTMHSSNSKSENLVMKASAEPTGNPHTMMNQLVAAAGLEGSRTQMMVHENNSPNFRNVALNTSKNFFCDGNINAVQCGIQSMQASSARETLTPFITQTPNTPTRKVVSPSYELSYVNSSGITAPVINESQKISVNSVSVSRQPHQDSKGNSSPANYLQGKEPVTDTISKIAPHPMNFQTQNRDVTGGSNNGYGKADQNQSQYTGKTAPESSTSFPDKTMGHSQAVPSFQPNSNFLPNFFLPNQQGLQLFMQNQVQQQMHAYNQLVLGNAHFNPQVQPAMNFVQQNPHGQHPLCDQNQGSAYTNPQQQVLFVQKEQQQQQGHCFTRIDSDIKTNVGNCINTQTNCPNFQQGLINKGSNKSNYTRSDNQCASPTKGSTPTSISSKSEYPSDSISNPTSTIDQQQMIPMQPPNTIADTGLVQESTRNVFAPPILGGAKFVVPTSHHSVQNIQGADNVSGGCESKAPSYRPINIQNTSKSDNILKSCKNITTSSKPIEAASSKPCGTFVRASRCEDIFLESTATKRLKTEQNAQDEKTKKLEARARNRIYSRNSRARKRKAISRITEEHAHLQIYRIMMECMKEMISLHEMNDDAKLIYGNPSFINQYNTLHSDSNGFCEIPSTFLQLIFDEDRIKFKECIKKIRSDNTHAPLITLRILTNSGSPSKDCSRKYFKVESQIQAVSESNTIMICSRPISSMNESSVPKVIHNYSNSTPVSKLYTPISAAGFVLVPKDQFNQNESVNDSISNN